MNSFKVLCNNCGSKLVCISYDECAYGPKIFMQCENYGEEEYIDKDYVPDLYEEIERLHGSNYNKNDFPLN